MNPLIRDMLMAFVRNAASALGVWLISKGLIEKGDFETVVAGIGAVILGLGGVLWTVYRRRVKLLAALASPSETTEHELETALADPLMQPPPASKRKDQKPYFKTSL